MDTPPPPPYDLPPSYEEATSQDGWGASSRLPSYRSPTMQRRNPYRRILPVHRNYTRPQEESFEDFYRSLRPSTHRLEPTETPAVVPPQLVPILPPPPAPPAPPHPPYQDPRVNAEERIRRLIRRLFLIVPLFTRIVRAGLAAAMRAAELQL
ncbi:hypothetical protein DXG01_004039 [Tephrocybe rancida]|nr:hypothetical protein DXG01_004039 [Tephrocybe rancida]